MTTRRLAVTATVIATVLGNGAAGWPQGNVRSMLDDATPASWNTRGAALPAAPKNQGNSDRRCRAAARPPQLNEDHRLRERGWDLVGGFQGGWDMLVILATAGYDGMCRPLQYRDFVFVRGVFAGTLSPRPMDSRTDGAIQRVYIQGARRLAADYARYDANDPLCCASRTTHVAFELATDGTVQPIAASTSKP